MWIKGPNEIIKHIPNNNKWCDIQIVNNALYINGKRKTDPYPLMKGKAELKEPDVQIFDRFLTRAEIVRLFEKSIKKKRKQRASANSLGTMKKGKSCVGKN